MQEAHSSKGLCGTKRSMRALGGGVKDEGSTPAVVTTTSMFSSASASRAIRTSLPSFWNSVEQVTSTSGLSNSSSQAVGFAGGSQMPGPTMRTLGGQSERGYSNGSAVM